MRLTTGAIIEAFSIAGGAIASLHPPSGQTERVRSMLLRKQKRLYEATEQLYKLLQKEHKSLPRKMAESSEISSWDRTSKKAFFRVARCVLATVLDPKTSVTSRAALRITLREYTNTLVSITQSIRTSMRQEDSRQLKLPGIIHPA